MKRSHKPIEEQVVVLTGASSGIGLATARLAAKRGARVMLAARDQEALQQAVADLEAGGAEAAYVVADVSDPDDVRRLADETIDRFGGFDSWINNAGVSIYGRMAEVPIEEARRLFDVNYWGVVYGSQIAAEHLRERGGAIINIGSAVSERAIPLQGHYSASKHAVKGFTQAFRVELEKDDAPITVTLIKPGSTNTPFVEHARTHMDEEATLPPPVYDPDVVARTIVDCCETPRREVSVGGGSKMIQALNVVPGLADRYMEWSIFRGQKQPAREASPAHAGDSLYESSAPGAQKHGDFDGRTRGTSTFTQARLHPLRTIGIAAAVGAAVTAMTRAVRS